MRIIRTISITFTTWVLTALVNALLAGTCLSIFPLFHESWPIYYVATFFSTLILSTPAYFIFWIIFITSDAAGRLFAILLKSGIVLSLTTYLLVLLVPFVYFGQLAVLLGVCTLVATITAIMVHHRSIQLLDSNKQISYV